MKRLPLLCLALIFATGLHAEESKSPAKSSVVWFETDGQAQEISASATKLIERVQTDKKAIDAIQAQAFKAKREDLSSSLSELSIYLDHSCAMLVTVADNVEFTPKLSGQLRKEFAFIVMHSSYTMDDVLLSARFRVHLMLTLNTGEEAGPTLRALGADLEAIRQLSWRIKCVPAPKQ